MHSPLPHLSCALWICCRMLLWGGLRICHGVNPVCCHCAEMATPMKTTVQGMLAAAAGAAARYCVLVNSLATWSVSPHLPSAPGVCRIDWVVTHAHTDTHTDIHTDTQTHTHAHTPALRLLCRHHVAVLTSRHVAVCLRCDRVQHRGGASRHRRTPRPRAVQSVRALLPRRRAAAMPWKDRLRVCSVRLGGGRVGECTTIPPCLA
jgi:hypothetical protein